VVVTKVRAKAGAQRQLEQAIRTMIAKVREEPKTGAPRYALYRHLEDPAVLILWESYPEQSAPDIDDGAANADLVGEIVGLIEGRPILETLIEIED
jgi:quinol monooxygenase YgiN